MNNILTSISLEKTIQPSLQLDAEKKIHGNAKHTLESAKQHIESFKGYRLLSTQYVNSTTKIDILCPAEHLYKATYDRFQRGDRCAECNGNAKHRLSNVKRHIESFGYRLRSTTQYVNAATKLDILCPVDHLYKATYSVFQQGQRCPECARVKKSHTIEAVKRFIESFGYKLISTTYLDSQKKLDILCPADHLYKATYNSFQQGQRCPECYNISKRRTMSNGEEWEPYLRRSKDEQAWRKAVLKRDARTCQACFFPSKKLCAHHIESYAKNIESRNDLTNGVTLCEPCHRELHSQYGSMTATRADLEEFTRLKCR